MDHIDARASLKAGAIGALGSVPGTVCAHPLDVLKIRMQTTDKGTLLDAARGVHREHGYRGFYKGLVPALEQRFLSRGPMFLVSEVSTQLVARHLRFGELGSRACGSVMSGYVVGFLQALSEYRKKLLSQYVVDAVGARFGHLISDAARAGQLRTGLLRRMHAAAVCSSVFDGTFFCTRDALSAHLNPPLAYGVAAATAVLVAYPADTAVARMLIVPPNQPISCMRHHIFLDARGFRGLPARASEFFISYAVMGLIDMILNQHIVWI
ncbi:Mitochondrial carnitine carrier [Symbiodinium microadriaticum]|uniref:Mitochondrial carnitine carrier n=1 Tax=Symbiodinium microadriaticum TaxID=2951 RepID=A0A1Q9CQN5_SYMMI|nr:Mitochondrial carnitine carrier [Symbiodinium microadriaticum]